MNNICAIPKLKSHHFVPKGIYITVYNNTVKQFKIFLKHHASDTPSVKRWRRATDEWNGYMERSYRNTMHDSKRVCLKEVIIILE